MTSHSSRAHHRILLTMFIAVLVGAALLLTQRSLERVQLGLSDWPFDIAFFHALIASAAQGQGFTQTASTHELNGILKLSHAFFLLPAYVPLYALVPGLPTLIFTQIFQLLLTSVPLMLLALHLQLARSTTLLLTLSFLLSPPLIRLCLADFNPLMASLPLLAGTLWAMTTNRHRFALLLAILTCLVREEMPIVIAGISLVLWCFQRTSRRIALSTLVLAGVIFVLSAALRPRTSYYIPFFQPERLLELLASTDSPERYWSQKWTHLSSYIPAGLGSAVLDPVLWLAALPLLVYQLGVSRYEWWHWTGPYVHHLAPLLPFVATAAVFGVARAHRWAAALERRWTSVPKNSGQDGKIATRSVNALLSLALILQLPASIVAWEQPLGRLDAPDEQAQRTLQAQNVATLLAKIPAQAAVAADYRWMALLSGRPILYCYEANFGTKSGPTQDGMPAPGLDLVDFFLLDMRHAEWKTRMDAAPDFTLQATAGDYQLFRRKMPVPN